MTNTYTSRRKVWLPQYCPKCGLGPELREIPRSIYQAILTTYYYGWSIYSAPDNIWGGSTWHARCGQCQMHDMMTSHDYLLNTISKPPRLGGNYTIPFPLTFTISD